jgi:glucose-6-phosphate dehydrogenase assembly protein OpcA
MIDYKDKQNKLAQKLLNIKDQYIVDSLNMAQRLANEIQEIRNENKEINELLQDKEIKIPIKKGK